MEKADFPRFYPIVDTAACRTAGVPPLDLARACLDGGARLLQIRAKDEPDDTVLRLAEACVAAARGTGARVIVNDRADIAALAGACGVHVGQNDLPPGSVRVAAPGLVVGLSTHTLDQIERAVVEPIDYLAVGPVFGTATKDTGYAAVGLVLVSAAAARSGATPVVAIGGITLDSAPRVLEAGASSVAVISDLFEGGVERRIRQFVETLG